MVPGPVALGLGSISRHSADDTDAQPQGRANYLMPVAPDISGRPSRNIIPDRIDDAAAACGTGKRGKRSERGVDQKPTSTI